MKPSEVVGVEVTLLPDNQVRYSLCLMALRQNTVVIEKKVLAGDDLDNLSQQIPSGAPVALVLNGKSILHKAVSGADSQVPVVDRLKASIPNVSLNAFYWQEYSFEGGAFFSLIRKEVLDALLNRLQKSGLWITSLSLGPFSVSSLLGWIESAEEETHLEFNGHHLTVHRQEIIAYKAGEKADTQPMVPVGEELVEGALVLPYAVALPILLQQPGKWTIPIGRIQQQRQEWEQSRLFRMAGWSVLGGFLLLLLLNFALFSQLSESNRELLSQMGSGDKKIAKMDTLKARLRERSVFFQNAGWLQSPRNSFYADGLVRTIPNDIALLEMAIQPLNERVSKTEKKPVFIQHTIRIKGQCKDPRTLNDWLKVVNELKWVEKTKEQNYSYDNGKQTGYFDFQIEVKGAP